VIKPLEEAILVNELDAATAGAGVSQRVIGLPRVPADPTHVALVLIVVVSDLARARARPEGPRRGRRSDEQSFVVAVVGDLLHRRASDRISTVGGRIWGKM